MTLVFFGGWGQYIEMFWFNSIGFEASRKTLDDLKKLQAVMEKTNRSGEGARRTRQLLIVLHIWNADKQRTP